MSQIDEYILENVQKHPRDIGRTAAMHFGISRQSIARHLRKLVDQGLITAKGNTKAREYQLKPIIEEAFYLDVAPNLEEDVIWREKVLPLMDGVRENVLNICQYGFTEILNNVVEHSESALALIAIGRNAMHINIAVLDYGVGIFKKIQTIFDLHDPRHALLELAKGKLTSNQASHTGEGIFFTSRMFDEFSILSGTLYFGRQNMEDDDWLIEVEDRDQSQGTFISMGISSNSHQTTAGIFDKYASGELNHSFSRTHVPIKLARYGVEQLVSRSQARRVLARFDRFKEILLDFKDIPTIGPAFADEIFRVYRNEHPLIGIRPFRATPEVQQVINRVIQRDTESN